MLTQVLSHVHLLVTPWTVACQVPLSMGFSRQEYWSEVPLLTPTEVKYKSQNTTRKIVINRPCNNRPCFVINKHDCSVANKEEGRARIRQ